MLHGSLIISYLKPIFAVSKVSLLYLLRFELSTYVRLLSKILDKTGA